MADLQLVAGLQHKPVLPWTITRPPVVNRPPLNKCAGYLKDEQCTKSYKTFLKECPVLSEYRLMLDRGQVCPTRIVGKGLKDMLEEYGQLKIQETTTSRDVWNKFDTVVTQLKNVATRNHVPHNARPQTISTFQKMRGRNNARRFPQPNASIENVSHSTSGASSEALGHTHQESLLSDAVSSPASSRDDESPNSSTEVQLLVPQSHHSGSALSGQDMILSSQQTAALGTSTPGRTQTMQPPFTHSLLPLQSPIVVSDSDHPFSPESAPGTPLGACAGNMARFTSENIHESPKSHLSPRNRQQSSLLTNRRKIGEMSSPIKFSKENNIEYVETKQNVVVAKVSNVKSVPLTKQEKRIEAMRTGNVSVLLEKTNNNNKPEESLEVFGSRVQASTCPGSGTAESDSKENSADRDVDAHRAVEETHEEDVTNPDNVCISSADELTTEVPDSMEITHFTPVKTASANKETTISLETPLKTPLKNFLDECSRESLRSPKRKSQAPKRRSHDPSTSKETPLVKPVQSQPPILSMPMFEELVSNAKFAEKLASSINQALCPGENTTEQTENTPNSYKSDDTDKTNRHTKMPTKESRVTPKKPNLRQKKSPSPRPFLKKRVSFETAELPEQSAGTVTTPTVTDGNESTGSIKPPLSVDELDSILEDTQMSESTIQGIINMTQTDPELDALFNLMNMDKNEFIEKEYGISLIDYKFTTPKKSSSISDTSTVVDLTSFTPTSVATSATPVSGVSSAVSVTSVFSLSTMTRSQAGASQGGTGDSIASMACQPSTQPPSTSLPLIHVSSVNNSTAASLTTSTSNNNDITHHGGGFLQLLHSSTDSHDSYVETVQMLATSQPSNTAQTLVKSQTVPQSTENVDKAKRNDETESIDSNSSEYTALELPNGEKVDVMPAGTDINSQYQTLQTLTHLQKLLHSGCALTATGPAVSTSTPCGSTSVVTPVKVVSNPSGCISETSPGTNTLIETVNNQGLMIRTQPKLDTVDTSGLGLISYQDESLTQQNAPNNNLDRGGKKKRGRPSLKMKQAATSRKQTKGRNTPIQNTPTATTSLSTLTSPSRRFGVRLPRNERRKNLGIPSTVVIPASVQEKTHGQPILTTIDNRPVWLAPVGISVSQSEANKSMMQNIRTTGALASTVNNPPNSSVLLQTLLQMPDAKIAPVPEYKVKNLLQSARQLRSSDNQLIGSASMGSSIVSSNRGTNEPSPRRQLFGGSSKQRSSKASTQLAAIMNNGVSSEVISRTDQPCDIVTTSTQSMGSMLFSPKSANTGAIFCRPSGNRGNPYGHGVFRIITSTANVNFTEQKTIVQSNDDMNNFLESLYTFKTPVKGKFQEGDPSQKKQNNVDNFKTPVKVTPQVVLTATKSVTKQVGKVEDNRLISMPTDFSALIGQSPEKKASFKTPEKKIAHPKARRVPLTTLGPSEGEDSFGAHFPNLVTNSELLSQPGEVVEIFSPSNNSSQGDSKRDTAEYEESGSVSVESAIKTIEGSIDVETAQTLIKFASKAVVTPKKSVTEVDQNSNHCIADNEVDTVQITDSQINGEGSCQPKDHSKQKSQSSAKKKSVCKSSEKKNKDPLIQRNLRRSSRLNKDKEDSNQADAEAGTVDEEVSNTMDYRRVTPTTEFTVSGETGKSDFKENDNVVEGSSVFTKVESSKSEHKTDQLFDSKEDRAMDGVVTFGNEIQECVDEGISSVLVEKEIIETEKNIEDQFTGSENTVEKKLHEDNIKKKEYIRKENYLFKEQVMTGAEKSHSLEKQNLPSLVKDTKRHKKSEKRARRESEKHRKSLKSDQRMTSKKERTSTESEQSNSLEVVVIPNEGEKSAIEIKNSNQEDHLVKSKKKTVKSLWKVHELSNSETEESSDATESVMDGKSQGSHSKKTVVDGKSPGSHSKKTVVDGKSPGSHSKKIVVDGESPGSHSKKTVVDGKSPGSRSKKILEKCRDTNLDTLNERNQVALKDLKQDRKISKNSDEFEIQDKNIECQRATSLVHDEVIKLDGMNKSANFGSDSKLKETLRLTEVNAVKYTSEYQHLLDREIYGSNNLTEMVEPVENSQYVEYNNELQQETNKDVKLKTSKDMPQDTHADMIVDTPKDTTQQAVKDVTHDSHNHMTQDCASIKSSVPEDERKEKNKVDQGLTTEAEVTTTDNSTDLVHHVPLMSDDRITSESRTNAIVSGKLASSEENSGELSMNLQKLSDTDKSITVTETVGCLVNLKCSSSNVEKSEGRAKSAKHVAQRDVLKDIKPDTRTKHSTRKDSKKDKKKFKSILKSQIEAIEALVKLKSPNLSSKKKRVSDKSSEGVTDKENDTQNHSNGDTDTNPDSRKDTKQLKTNSHPRKDKDKVKGAKRMKADTKDDVEEPSDMAEASKNEVNNSVVVGENSDVTKEFTVQKICDKHQPSHSNVDKSLDTPEQFDSSVKVKSPGAVSNKKQESHRDIKQGKGHNGSVSHEHIKPDAQKCANPKTVKDFERGGMKLINSQRPKQRDNECTKQRRTRVVGDALVKDGLNQSKIEVEGIVVQDHLFATIGEYSNKASDKHKLSGSSTKKNLKSPSPDYMKEQEVQDHLFATNAESSERTSDIQKLSSSGTKKNFKPPSLDHVKKQEVQDHTLARNVESSKRTSDKYKLSGISTKSNLESLSPDHMKKQERHTEDEPVKQKDKIIKQDLCKDTRETQKDTHQESSKHTKIKKLSVNKAQKVITKDRTSPDNIDLADEVLFMSYGIAKQELTSRKKKAVDISPDVHDMSSCDMYSFDVSEINESLVSLTSPPPDSIKEQNSNVKQFTKIDKHKETKMKAEHSDKQDIRIDKRKDTKEDIRKDRKRDTLKDTRKERKEIKVKRRLKDQGKNRDKSFSQEKAKHSNDKVPGENRNVGRHSASRKSQSEYGCEISDNLEISTHKAAETGKSTESFTKDPIQMQNTPSETMIKTTESDQGNNKTLPTISPDKLEAIKASVAWRFPMAKLVGEVKKEITVLKKSPQKKNQSGSTSKTSVKHKLPISTALFGLKSPAKKSTFKPSVLKGEEAPSSGNVHRKKDNGTKRKPEAQPEGEASRKHKKYKGYPVDVKGLDQKLADADKLERLLQKLHKNSDAIDNVEKSAIG